MGVTILSSSKCNKFSRYAGRYFAREIFIAARCTKLNRSGWYVIYKRNQRHCGEELGVKSSGYRLNRVYSRSYSPSLLNSPSFRRRRRRRRFWLPSGVRRASSY